MHLGNSPRQALEQVVAGIDETWHRQMVRRVNLFVRLLRQLSGASNGFKAMSADEQRRIAQLASPGWVGIVKGGDAPGVPDKQGVS